MAIKKCIKKTNIWLPITTAFILVSLLQVQLFQVNCNPVTGSGITLTSIQVQESKPVSRLETYKNVQVFVYRIPVESTLATFTLSSNGSWTSCDVLPLKFHLRWRAIPIVSIQSKSVVSYGSTNDGIQVVTERSADIRVDGERNTTVAGTTSTFRTRSSQPYEYLLPGNGDNGWNGDNAAGEEEDKETEIIYRQLEEDSFQTDLKSDSVPVQMNITNPLPGVWIGLAYINSTDDRIQQKGLFTRCTTWIQSRLMTYGISSKTTLDQTMTNGISSKTTLDQTMTNGISSKTTPDQTKSDSGEKLVTLSVAGSPIHQSLSMSKSPRYFRFFSESSERQVKVTISNCSTNRILGSDLLSDPTSCPLKVNYRKRGLPSSDHKSGPTLNCSYLPSNCTVESLPVTNDGFNYLEVTTIWQEEEDRNRDRYDYNVTFAIQVSFQDSTCGQKRSLTSSSTSTLSNSLSSGSVSVDTLSNGLSSGSVSVDTLSNSLSSGSVSVDTNDPLTTSRSLTTDHKEHKSSIDTIVAPTVSTPTSTTAPVFEVIRTTTSEPETTVRHRRQEERVEAEEAGEKEKRASFSSTAPSSADYETSSEESFTSPDVIDTVGGSDIVDTNPINPDPVDTNPIDGSSSLSHGSSDNSGGETSFVPGSNPNGNTNHDVPMNPDDEFGAWTAHLPGSVDSAGFIPSRSSGFIPSRSSGFIPSRSSGFIPSSDPHFASPLRRHRFYDRYVNRHHRSHRDRREVSGENGLTCPERMSLVRYNQQGSFNFRYDYSQGTGSKFNGSKVFPDPLIPLKNSDENNTHLTILDFDIFDLLDSGGTLSIQLSLDKNSFNTTYHNVSVQACLSYDNPLHPDFSLGSHGHCLKTIQVNSSSSPVVNSNGKDSYVSELLVPFPKSGKWFLSLKSSCYFDRKDIISHLVSSSTADPIDPTSEVISVSSDGKVTRRPKVIPVPCEYNTTSITVRIKSSSCPSQCSEHGKCALVFPSSGEITFGTCLCKPGWTGWSCDQIDPKVQLSEEQVLTNFLLLVLSNLLFLLPILVCFFRCQLTETVVYTLTMISSSLYHACDSSSEYSRCIGPMNLLQFGDFYSALLAFWITLVSLGNMRDRCKSFLHFTGAIAIAFLVEYDRTSLWSFILPVGTGLLIMLLSWMSHCVKRRRCFPSGLLWCCSIFPGILIATAGLVVYSLLETRENYPITHSVWHGTCALALLFLVPSIRTGRRKRGRNSGCGPSLDSDDEDDDNDTFRTKGSSDTYYELITDEASHLARHLPPGATGGASSSSHQPSSNQQHSGSGHHASGSGHHEGGSGYSGMIPSSSHRNSVNYTDRPIPAVRGHHRDSVRRD